MDDKMDDLKKALKGKPDKTNIARASKKKLAGIESKSDLASPAMRRAVSGPKTYTIASGDTLSSIAKKYGKTSWKEVYDANKDVIGDDPNKIRVGMKLKI